MGMTEIVLGCLKYPVDEPRIAAGHAAVQPGTIEPWAVVAALGMMLAELTILVVASFVVAFGWRFGHMRDHVYAHWSNLENWATREFAAHGQE